MNRIPISGPWVTDREVEYTAAAARDAWYGNANVFHERFERAFRDYLGVHHAVALPSCTSAIHLSLLALGVGPGDEVIVPDITWIGSAAPIVYVGATPVFADVDPDTWCLSANSLAECVTERTKAIIPVDLYGGVPDWDAIHHVADSRGIPVIEDAAEAIGSEHRTGKAGTFGATGVFSFHGSKTLTTGEGGMLVTDQESLCRRILFLRDHGRVPGDRMFLNAEVAFKYKMSSLQAAFGLAQIERIEELVQRKREIFGWYRDRLGGIPGVALNAEPPQTRNTYWMVTVRWEAARGLEKETVMRRLADQGIDSRPFFHPLSGIPAFAASEQAKIARERNRIARRISPFGVNLPSALNLTEAQVDYVAKAVTEILAESQTDSAGAGRA